MKSIGAINIIKATKSVVLELVRMTEAEERLVERAWEISLLPESAL